MIKKLSGSEGATIGVEVSGKITSEDESQWIEIFNKLIEQHDSINILVVLNGKINFGVDVAYEDLKWTFKHLKNMNKFAIISESRILGWLVAADSPFGKLVGVNEKYFELSQLPEAWRWIKE